MRIPIVAAVLISVSATSAIAQQAGVDPKPQTPAGQTPASGVDPRPPNATGQTPAFPCHTRAPERKSNVAFDVVTVA